MAQAQKKLTVKQIDLKIQQLKTERQTWETHWQELADYILPNKNTVTNQKSPGQKRSVQVLDSTGIQSNELLAGALHGLLTSPNSQWFELTTGDVDLDRDDDVRFFLQKSTDSMHNVLNNSNFQTEIHEVYLDLCCFGTASSYMDEDAKYVVRFSTKFIAEYYIVENAKGVVDQNYREWKWDASKLVEEFGFANVPKRVQDSYTKSDGIKFRCQQAVYPRSMVDPTHKSAFAYISQYTLPEENVELRMGGYREFPYIVPRWTKGTGESYGRSPGMNALPDIKTINSMTETTIIAAQKVVDPPIQLPDDGFIMPIVTKPGGINYYRAGSNDVIKPVFNNAQVDFGYQALDDRRKRIRSAYYVDQLQLENGPQMTATEVLQRTEEKMRLLGPMLGRQQSELLRPMIDRLFGICLRRGIIKDEDIPQKLRGKQIDVRYSSLIAKSQRVAEGQNIMRYMEAITPFINLDPTVGDNINGDAAAKVLAGVFGAPQEMIRKSQEVVAKRNARAQAQQQAVQAQQQQQQADSAPKVVDAMNKLSQPQGT